MTLLWRDIINSGMIVLCIVPGKVEAAISSLMEALKDEELVVRRGAVNVLGAMKVEAAIPSLMEALKDEEPFVRASAAEALMLLV